MFAWRATARCLLLNPASRSCLHTKAYGYWLLLPKEYILSLGPDDTAHTNQRTEIPPKVDRNTHSDSYCIESTELVSHTKTNIHIQEDDFAQR
ncbi:hypothetical protein VTL71DRAFT_15182 [Oculimacula yallundae]|uniref:Secreted protein n=1 Tax=Oculimacula yallundae TaxID=86028 RepID=A0ABR4CFV0_9HELO